MEKERLDSHLLPPSDETFMRRALRLASNGAGAVSPNPMVGAVIVAPDGRIIGEGFHRRYGGPHAEVNAVNSVAPQDEVLIPQSTIYVTLEPCSHYGKTPPCAELLIRKKFRRVVVATLDPFPKVAGRGVKMIREAGIEVETGLLEEEARRLNRRFMTAHSLGRPWIILKWASSADGFLAAKDPQTGKPKAVTFSTPLSAVWMHRERSLVDAILIGGETLRIDNPSLTCRLWPGNSPKPVILSSRQLPPDANVSNREPIFLNPKSDLGTQIKSLYSDHGITSLMVEGGARTLELFLKSGLFDEIRHETAPCNLGNSGYAKVKRT